MLDSDFGLEVVDPSSGAVIATCAGAHLTSVARFDMALGDKRWINFGNTEKAMSAVAGPPWNVVPQQKTFLLDGTITGDNDGVLDLPSGRMQPLAIGDARAVMAVVKDKLLVGRPPPTSDRPQSPSSFCILPSVGAPESACSPIPGATDDGWPTVHPDGTVGWAPAQAVPARFGALTGWAVTDGRGVFRFSQFGPGDKRDAEFTAVPTLDGSALVYSTGAGLEWATVDHAGRAGVTGTLHVAALSAAAPGSMQLESGGLQGFEVLHGGRSIIALTILGKVVRVDEGSPTPKVLATVRPVEQPSATGGQHLVYWPASAATS